MPLGGLIFGSALLRSGGLALPLGLHWGGNWALTDPPATDPEPVGDRG
jgi:membrane protease YdiL (CAAX protease family)